MTYGEVLMRKGQQKGLQEGLQKGRLRDKQEVLLRQLGRKFTLTDAERERIQSSEDPDALDAALDEIIVAESKEAVLGKLGGDRESSRT